MFYSILSKLCVYKDKVPYFAGIDYSYDIFLFMLRKSVNSSEIFTFNIFNNILSVMWTSFDWAT